MYGVPADESNAPNSASHSTKANLAATHARSSATAATDAMDFLGTKRPNDLGSGQNYRKLQKIKRQRTKVEANRKMARQNKLRQSDRQREASTAIVIEAQTEQLNGPFPAQIQIVRSGLKSRMLPHIDLHGATHIRRSKNIFGKAFWSGSILLSSIFAGWICIILLADWLGNGPQITRINYKSVSNLRFPAITVCDDAAKSGSYFLSAERLAADNISDAMVRLMLLSGPIWLQTEVPSLQMFRDVEIVEFKKRLVQLYGASPANQLKGFFLKYGVNCSEVFSSCVDSTHQRYNCCDIFQPVFSLRNGLCFGSKAQNMPMVSLAGMPMMRLAIQIKRTNVWLSRAKKDQDGALNGATLTVCASNGIEQSTAMLDDSMIIKHGYWPIIRIRAKHLMKKPGSGECRTREELCYFQDFTASNCLAERLLFSKVNNVMPRNCLLPALHLTSLGSRFGTEQSESEDGADKAREFFYARSHKKFARRKAENSNGLSLLRQPCKHLYHEPQRFCKAEEILIGLLSSNATASAATFTPMDGLLHYAMESALQQSNKSGTAGSTNHRCQPPCDSWRFSIQTTLQTMAEHSMFHSQAAESKDDLAFAGLTLSFADAEYEEIRDEDAFQWFHYFAMVAGVCSFSICASIISILQCAVYVIQGACRPRILHKPTALKNSGQPENTTVSQLASKQTVANTNPFEEVAPTSQPNHTQQQAINQSSSKLTSQESRKERDKREAKSKPRRLDNSLPVVSSPAMANDIGVQNVKAPKRVKMMALPRCLDSTTKKQSATPQIVRGSPPPIYAAIQHAGAPPLGLAVAGARETDSYYYVVPDASGKDGLLKVHM